MDSNWKRENKKNQTFWNITCDKKKVLRLNMEFYSIYNFRYKQTYV